MNIGIDLRCLPGDGSPGAGIAHAARALSRELIECGEPQIIWTLFACSDAAVFEDERQVVSRTRGRVRFVRLENASGAALRRALRRTPCDSIFVPSGSVAPGLLVPTVPWVHDVAIFDHPEWFSEDFFHRQLTTNLFRRGIRKARAVLAVSEFTKQELVSHFSVDPSRVSVTLEGGDLMLSMLHGESLVEAKRQAKHRVAQLGITNPFILCMGTLEPRKNIPFFLEAWMDARSQFVQPTDFVIAGRDGWKLEPIKKALDVGRTYASEGASRLHRIETPNDHDRRDLLLAADLVVVPSLYEGFGLVALEAMQAESAVLVSRVGGLMEVVGDAGIQLSVSGKEEWTRVLVNFMNDDVSRREMALRGKSRSEGMTWKRSAEIVFRALTEGPG